MTTTYTFYYNKETGEKFNDLDVKTNVVLCIESHMLTEQQIEQYAQENPSLAHHIRSDLGNALKIEQSKRR